MKNREPHFLIAIPTYNRAHLLPKVVESILSQSYKNYSVLFLNDCSTDTTEDYITSLPDYGKLFFHYKMPENSGVNATRNMILRISKEKFQESFIYFIDDDDLLYKDALETAAGEICKNPNYNWYALTCIYPDGKPISKLKKFGEMSYIDDFMFGKTMRGDLTNIVKVSCIGQSHFSKKFKNAEIWYFWTSLSLNNKLFTINKIGSIKEYLPGGITKNGFNRDKAIQVAQYKIDTLEPIVGKKKLRHQYVTLAKNLIKQGDKKEARKVLKNVLKTAPFYFRQYPHWVKSFL